MKKMMIILAVMAYVIGTGYAWSNQVARSQESWTPEVCTTQLSEMKTRRDNLGSELQQNTLRTALRGVSPQYKREYKKFLSDADSWIDHCKDHYDPEYIASVKQSTKNVKKAMEKLTQLVG